MPSDVFRPADIIPDSVGEITVMDAIADVTVLPAIRMWWSSRTRTSRRRTAYRWPTPSRLVRKSENAWPIEAVFVLGDVCYLLPYTTFQEFMDDPNDRFDIAQEIFENYPVPVYPLIGNTTSTTGRNRGSNSATSFSSTTSGLIRTTPWILDAGASWL